jgi:hypothetical protein
MCQYGRSRSLAGAALLKSAGFTDVQARGRALRRASKQVRGWTC